MKHYKFYIYVLVVIALAGCKPELDSYEPSAGNADFSKYVALGNSLTAGYKDGALSLSGQKVSYPNIIAQQLKLVGGGEFTQPLMYDDAGFGGRLILGLQEVKDCMGQPVPGASPTLGPIPYGVDPDPRNMLSSQELFESTNLGVPGAKSFHLLFPGYGMLNPYFKRFASSDTASIISQAVSLNPTFFSLWIGNNDVLQYAIAGGEAVSLTSPPFFEMAYSMLIDKLTKFGAKGVIANIPDIDKIAFFTTFPYNALKLTDQTQVDQLNAAYAPLGISFSLGANPLIVADPSAIGGVRQIKSTELVLLSLPQDSIVCAQWGSAKPIDEKFYLSDQELSDIRETIKQYNLIIKNIADAKGLALVDANSFFKNAVTGFVYDGAKFNASYITGGINSIDGVHLTPRGNALVANAFIEAINLKYNSRIPLVDVTDYLGLIFP
ncbi:MAG: SGNH/GDSL hydrolase family protein [Omnitrophica WOR_2 bacterium]